MMLPEFLTPLVLQRLEGRRSLLALPLVYRTATGRLFTVPAGFVTDGGSIPRLVWAWWPPYGTEADAAFVLHDYAYDEADQLELSRQQADGLLDEALRVCGVRRTARWAIVAAVRLGGWVAWRAHRNAGAEREQPDYPGGGA